MKKKFRVYASQEIIYYKDVEAETEEQAEELAWEDNDSNWIDCHYGDWQLEENTEELTS